MDDLESLRSELLRVKARESRSKSEYKKQESAFWARIELLECQVADLEKRLNQQNARDKNLAALQKENAGLRQKFADLQKDNSEKLGFCPIDGRHSGRCGASGEVLKFVSELEDYQKELLRSAGFNLEDPGHFLCRCGSRQALVSLWQRARQHMVEHGQRPRLVAFLDAMLGFHLLGNAATPLKKFSPRLDKFDKDEASSYWVLPWRENWWKDPENIRQVLLPGLRYNEKELLVEPLLALK